MCTQLNMRLTFHYKPRMWLRRAPPNLFFRAETGRSKSRSRCVSEVAAERKRAEGTAIPTKKRKACKPLARQRACAFGRAQEGTHNGGKAGERRKSRAVAAALQPPLGCQSQPPSAFTCRSLRPLSLRHPRSGPSTCRRCCNCRSATRGGRGPRGSLGPLRRRR